MVESGSGETAPCPLDELRQERKGHRARAPDHWWYYAKKAIPLFPGHDTARRGTLLNAYYAAWEMRLSARRRIANRIMLAGFRRWAPWRAGKIAARYDLGTTWAKTAADRASRHVIDPAELAFFRIADEVQIGTYLRSFEWAEITKQINPAQWRKDCVLAHKIDFHLLAAEHGLPLPKLHAVVLKGKVKVLEPLGDGRLFLKPDSGRGGASAFACDPPPAARTGPDALAAYLRGLPKLKNGDWVVQQKLAVHPDLAGIALDAMPTARLITMPDEAGKPEVVATYLRLASAPSVLVDNFSAGGLIVLIDQESGVLGVACIKRDLSDHSHHPLNGAPICGRHVPFWREMLALVADAHSTIFPQYNLIGWDIGITPVGPVIVEANGKPGVQGVQMSARRGLGEMRFGELVAWHLARA